MAAQRGFEHSVGVRSRKDANGAEHLFVSRCTDCTRRGAQQRIPDGKQGRRGSWQNTCYECARQKGAAMGKLWFPGSLRSDNIYSVSGSVLGAVDILEDVERHLASDWGLQIKSSSRSVLTAAGRAIPDGHDAMKWPVQDIFPVLGHRLDSRGSSWPCWERTKQSMWGAFYRTRGAQGYKQLPHKLQNRTLNRCILPILEYRCSRWSYQETLAEDIDRVQRKMFSILAKVPRQAGKNDDTYFRRRRRQVSVTCKTHGLWSIRFAERICKWDAHLCRPANRNSWAAKLLQWQGREWLAIRRARFTSGTCTRLQPGTPCPRWHDGVASAHAALERRAG